MRSLPTILALFALVGALGAGPAGPVWAEEPAAAQIPVKVVAGKLVVSCDIATRFRRIPVTLFVEYESKCGLRLHNRAAQGIRAENRDGSPNEITLHLPDLRIQVPKREHGPEKVYEKFTKFHSPELGEVALVGTIGAEILKDYYIVFDLRHGLMHLAPPKEAEEDAAAEAVEGTTVVPITLTNDLVWFTTQYEDGRPGALALGTARYDSIIDADVCAARGKPAGDVGALSVGGVDLAKYVAFRPEEVRQVHADGVVGVTGLNFLEHFRVEVDRENHFVRFTETLPAAFPKADLAFFRARAEEDGDEMEAFLEGWPKERLSGEAAQLLVDLRLEEDASAEIFARALRWVNDATAQDLRATAMLDLMKKLAEEGKPDHVVAAGAIGIESGRKDRYPNAVHKIHGKMGAVLLEAGEAREAWRHLLSAAFGMPEDGMINLNLGRFYEQSDRIRRAFSRYVQAVIVPESGPMALAGLERLQAKMPGGERFSVDLVERLIAGRVDNFGIATKFKPTEATDNNRVVLAEFFTNAEFEAALGGALGNEGMLSHFPRTRVAALSYHLPSPQIDPLVNELAVFTAGRRNVDKPTVHVFNGISTAPGAARADQKEKLYNVLKQNLLADLAGASPFTLSMEARITDGVVSGALVVQGPQRRDTDVQIVLAEKGVLFPGKSKVVIHRMVARGSLTGSLSGVPWVPEDGAMRIPFSRALADITAENERYLEKLEAQGLGSVKLISTRIDPKQVTLVAYVRGATGQIVQALQVDPQAGE